MQIIEITDSNFESIIENNEKVIIKVQTSWCSPCKTMKPFFEAAAESIGNNAVLGELDADMNSVITTKFGVRSVPTTLFILNKELKTKHSGLLTTEEIIKKVNELK